MDRKKRTTPRKKVISVQNKGKKNKIKKHSFNVKVTQGLIAK